jgi:biopolymer transport protein ExbD
MALAKRNEGAKISSDINVTPMVDVMLVLLIIFMVVTPMLQHGISVDMAQVNNPTPMADADKEDALLVSIMRNGDVFFGTDKITPENLTAYGSEEKYSKRPADSSGEWAIEEIDHGNGSWPERRPKREY